MNLGSLDEKLLVDVFIKTVALTEFATYPLESDAEKVTLVSPNGKISGALWLIVISLSTLSSAYALSKKELISSSSAEFPLALSAYVSIFSGA